MAIIIVVGFEVVFVLVWCSMAASLEPVSSLLCPNELQSANSSQSGPYNLRIQCLSLFNETLYLVESDILYEIPVENIEHDHLALYNRISLEPIAGQFWYSVPWLQIRDPSLEHLNQPGTLKQLDIHHWTPGPVLEYTFEIGNYYVRNGTQQEPKPQGYLFPLTSRQSTENQNYFRLVSDKLGARQYLFQYLDHHLGLPPTTSSQAPSTDYSHLLGQLTGLDEQANTSSQSSSDTDHRVILLPINPNSNDNQSQLRSAEQHQQSLTKFRSAYYFLMQTNSNRTELRLIYQRFAGDPTLSFSTNVETNETINSEWDQTEQWPRSSDLLALLPFGFINQNSVFLWSVGHSRLYTFDYLENLGSVEFERSNDGPLTVPIQSYSASQFFRCSVSQEVKEDYSDDPLSQQDYLLDLQRQKQQHQLELQQIEQQSRQNDTLVYKSHSLATKLGWDSDIRMALLPSENILNVIGLVLLIVVLMAVLTVAMVILGNYRTIQQRLERRSRRRIRVQFTQQQQQQQQQQPSLSNSSGASLSGRTRFFSWPPEQQKQQLNLTGHSIQSKFIPSPSQSNSNRKHAPHKCNHPIITTNTSTRSTATSSASLQIPLVPSK